ncbi:MAG: hypothetical protein J6J45_02435 [Clostridia bacterium]|nr:hypothetical protein [Clostridia bacterium]
MLKKRVILTLLAIFSLITGLLIYLFLRKDTYLHGYFSAELCNYVYVNVKSNILTDFIRYYLPDFLWAFAFGAALTAVSYSHNRIVIILFSAVSFLIGVLFEFVQYFGIVNGTFDYFDILMYAVAALTCAAINIKLFKGVN